jgi:hypothetical protein
MLNGETTKRALCIILLNVIPRLGKQSWRINRCPHRCVPSKAWNPQKQRNQESDHKAMGLSCSS